MTKAQTAAALAAAALAVGIATVVIDDTVIEAPSNAAECGWQPPFAPVVPCLADGGWDSNEPSYQDAGCLAQVCPRLARVRQSGGSYYTPEELAAKQSALQAKPGVIAPVLEPDPQLEPPKE